MIKIKMPDLRKRMHRLGFKRIIIFADWKIQVPDAQLPAIVAEKKISISLIILHEYD